MKKSDQVGLKYSYRNRFVEFHELMRHNIRDILLVSSLYDSFVLGEDGGLYELLLNEYMGLNLSHAPGITWVSSAKEAIELASQQSRFDLIITTLHLQDLHAIDYARKLRKMGVTTPLVLLTYDNRELNTLLATHDVSCFDKVFMWQGNFRILLAIIKCIEDIHNVERDTRLAGVQSVILIEDSVKFYSSYLPIIYTELMRHSQEVIEEGMNLSHKMLRMRARPKILLCHTYEEAWRYFETYHETILGVISDIRFPHGGESDPQAGIEFARNVKKSHRDIPILLQSNDIEMKPVALGVGASFLLKNSPMLMHELRDFMKKYLSFGDFVFSMPDGTEVAHAHDLRELEQRIRTVPAESLIFHAERNHFSNWLKARTEFYLAHKLRPRKVSDYASPDDLRQALITYIREYHEAQHRGTIVDFDTVTFDGSDTFTRMGSGSIGGKGRGIVFVESLLNASQIRKRYDGIRISVPAATILQTDVFDDFMEQNNLSELAVRHSDDEEISRRFLDASMPEHVVDWLRRLLEVVNYPLAIRSSSLLEDSSYLPFAGVYETYMVPNNHRDLEVRLQELIVAIKRVYASTFSHHAKAYVSQTPYRLEEEKMAVIIQKMVGRTHRNNFYPDFSGVARSHNYYPIKPMVSDDGIASVALGLGAMVVEGGATVRFCPRYPRHLLHFTTAEDAVINSQKEFFALNMPPTDADCDHNRQVELVRLSLNVAEEDGVLGPLGSTCSLDNNIVYDGVSRPGIRIVSFAHVLKGDVFPLADILRDILELGRAGMNTPVEMEFSVNLSVPPGQPKEFHVLQLRPMVISQEREQLEIGDIEPERLVCRSNQVFGNGLINNVHDIVFVDRQRFDRANTVQIAREIGLFNLELAGEQRPYLLVGIGRWGSADPWLGIPVTWDDIAGARVIVETGFEDMKVTPSQGTHFFQNLNAFQIGYFTVNADGNHDFIDWPWLSAGEAVKTREYTRHLRFEKPLIIKMDGHNSEGVILKPEN